METLLEYIGPFFGLASAIITTITFFKEKMKHKIPVLVSVLFLSGIAIWIWSEEKEKAYDFELLSQQQQYEALIGKEKTRYVVADAKIVASSVDMYGVLSYGKHLANLGTMLSFYHRHEHLYGTQYKKLSKQYDNWESFFRQKREKGESIYSSDYSALEGLVESNYKFVQSIAKSEPNT